MLQALPPDERPGAGLSRQRPTLQRRGARVEARRVRDGNRRRRRRRGGPRRRGLRAFARGR